MGQKLLSSHEVIPSLKTKQRRSNPSYQRRRNSIVAAARELFSAEGYNVAMAEVALLAGVSRKTLYSQFGTKEALFNEVMRRAGESFVDAFTPSGALSVRDVLLFFAEQYEAHSLSYDSMQLYRLMLADLSKFPSLAQSFYNAAINRAADALCAQFERLIENNEIIAVNPRATAEGFIGAVTGLVRHRIYAGLGLDSEAVRGSHIHDMVDLFVRGLAVEDPARR